MRRLLVFLVVSSSWLPAHADPDLEAQWRGVAATQLRDRMRSEWSGMISSESSIGWRIELGGKTFAGDWVLRHSDGWTYLFDGATVRCRIQPGTPSSYVSCNNADSVEDKHARITLAGRPHARTVATLDMFHRGVYGKRLGMTIEDGVGHATIETIVSSPMAESRTSRRYRAAVTFTTEGATVGTPVLVEQYRETCMAVHGCHSVHWNCQRSR